MAVYYKFKSAKDYDRMPIESQFITVTCLKRRIFESKHMEKGTDYDLIICNAQTNEEYVDGNAVILKNMTVLIRRVPGLPQKPIVVEQEEPRHNKVEENPVLCSVVTSDSSTEKYPEEFDWNDFGNDLYSNPEVLSAQSGNPTKDLSPERKIVEEEKVKSLVEIPALDWNSRGQDSYDGRRGFERSMSRRMISGNVIGQGGFERKTPPMGYICHRCKVSGHFIQHCPTNGDPNYDVKRVKPPTGIPLAMLMATLDGSYLLPSGAAAVLKPNEAAFEKEIQGLPSTQRVGDLPPELRCPLCKEVMKDAVFTSKCCFRSFCDKCIREYIITKSTCLCGTIDVLADDLIPNKTLRDTIIHILNSTTSSTITNSTSSDNGGSVIHVPSMESTRHVLSKVPPPTQSAASKDDQKPSSSGQSAGVKGGDEKVGEDAIEGKAVKDEMHCLDKKTAKSSNVPETTPESVIIKETTSLLSQEVQEKLLENEQGKKMKKKTAGKKMKRKKVHLQHRDDMQWGAYNDLEGEGYTMMSSAPLACDPYMATFGAGTPFMGYPFGPFDCTFGRMLSQNQFVSQVYMMSAVLPREHSRDDKEIGSGGGSPAKAKLISLFVIILLCLLIVNIYFVIMVYFNTSDVTNCIYTCSFVTICFVSGVGHLFSPLFLYLYPHPRFFLLDSTNHAASVIVNVLPKTVAFLHHMKTMFLVARNQNLAVLKDNLQVV